MELSPQALPGPTGIRLLVDYDIQVEQTMLAGLTEQQLILLRSILASSQTLSRIARMSVEADLSGVTGAHLDDLFQGPSNEELWDCALGCLPEADTAYWQALKNENDEAAYQEVIAVFLVFQVAVRRATVEERLPSSEPTRKTVGPVLDAEDL